MHIIYLSTKLSSALECTSEVLVKRGERHSPTVTFLLQHLLLVLRCKSEMSYSLLMEDICTPESFCWRTQLQYSTEMESLYSLPDQTRCPSPAPGPSLAQSSVQSTLGSRPHLPTSSRTARSTVGPGGVAKDSSNSLVASSKSLLVAGSRLGNASTTTSSSELNRSMGLRSLGGCLPPLKCFVHCHKTTLHYGFEFLGSNTHLILTPQTERCLLSVVSAVAGRTFPSLTSSSTGTVSTGKDLAVVSE